MESRKSKGNYAAENTRDSNLVSEISGRVEMNVQHANKHVNEYAVGSEISAFVSNFRSFLVLKRSKFCFLPQALNIGGFVYVLKGVRGHCHSHNAVRRVNK